VRNGKIAHLKNGWMYWVDSADKQPCIGTGSAVSWQLKANGLQGHSGLPHKAINAINLGYEATIEIANRFHKKFPPHPKEQEYGFGCSSSFKITMVSYPSGAVNQIPGQCTFSGDIRVVPFYPIDEVIKSVQQFVAEVQADIFSLPTRGPGFSYQVGDKKGSFEFKWNDGIYKGIACNLESAGFHVLNEATKAVLGSSKPYSLTGSLPCVWDLQNAGFDLQVCGFGLTSVYHGVDEYCLISDMKQGYLILNKVILALDAQSK
jgi:acetylornithine deacetylase